MNKYRLYNQYVKSNELLPDELGYIQLALLQSFKTQQDDLAQALVKSNWLSIEPVENTYHLIIRNSIYPFRDHLDNKLFIDEFDKCVGNKIEIDMGIFHYDPHCFIDVDDDLLLDEQNVDLLLEMKGGGALFKRFLIEYSKNGNGRKKSLDKYLSDICNKKDKSSVVIVPITFLDDYYDCSFFMKKYSQHNIFAINILPHLLPADKLIDNASIESNKRDIDVFLSGSLLDWLYPYRTLTYTKIKNNHKYKVLDDTDTYWQYQDKLKSIALWCANKSLLESQSKRAEASFLIDDYYLKYASKLRDSKLGVVGNNMFGYAARRYFEYMSNGCVCVGQLPKFADKYGFKHMVNMYCCEPDEIEDAIDFLLANENIRLEIAKNARDFVNSNYTAEHMVSNLFTDIDRIIEIKKV